MALSDVIKTPPRNVKCFNFRPTYTFMYQQRNYKPEEIPQKYSRISKHCFIKSSSVKSFILYVCSLVR